jgi:cytochrome P450
MRGRAGRKPRMGASPADDARACRRVSAGRRRGPGGGRGRRRAEPADDLLSDLVAGRGRGPVQRRRLVTLVWHLVLAGQTPTNLIANAVETLLRHPDQLAALRADTTLMPSAVEELLRWCGPQLLTIPRDAREDVELWGVVIRKGEPVTAAIVSANRDPRGFPEPDRLDVTRPAGSPAHLGFAHGPHFCLGARWRGSRPRSRSPPCCAASPTWRSPHLGRLPGRPTRAPGGWPHCP